MKIWSRIKRLASKKPETGYTVQTTGSSFSKESLWSLTDAGDAYHAEREKHIQTTGSSFSKAVDAYHAEREKHIQTADQLHRLQRKYSNLIGRIDSLALYASTDFIEATVENDTEND